MTEMSSYTPGTFCWIELSTSDAAAAKQFYHALFGWSAADMEYAPGMVYTMCQIEGKNAAALYQQGPQEQGVPPHWNSYISVADAAETAAKVAAAGGTVLMETMDVMEFGRMCLIQDPTGGVVGAWEPRAHIGASLVNQPGTLTWNELATRDAEKAAGFYTQVFGWEGQVSQMGGTDYTTFYNHGNMNCGMIQMTAEWGDLPPHWMVYFAVADCDASAEKAKSLGGQIHVPPSDIPSMGRFAVLTDPQGATFSIFQLNNPS